MTTVQLIVSNQTREIEVKEWKGQRVVTFKDVDDLHDRTMGAARKTFNSHRDQFVEGEDYFVLNTDEAFKHFGVKAPNGLILLTESGYLMVVKPFTDDLAWQVQRQLVKSYFKAKAAIATTQEDILIYALQSQKEMKAEIQRLRLVVDNEIFLTEHQKASVQDAVIERTHTLRRKGYEAHYQSIYRALKSHFSVSKYDKILRKDFDDAMDLIKGWYPKKKEEQS